MISGGVVVAGGASPGLCDFCCAPSSILTPSSVALELRYRSKGSIVRMKSKW
jgi:hypothetical protein